MSRTTTSTNPLHIPPNLVILNHPSTIYPQTDHFLCGYYYLAIPSFSLSKYVFLRSITIIAIKHHLYLLFSNSENSNFSWFSPSLLEGYSFIFCIGCLYITYCWESNFVMVVRSAFLSSQK